MPPSLKVSNHRHLHPLVLLLSLLHFLQNKHTLFYRVSSFSKRTLKGNGSSL